MARTRGPHKNPHHAAPGPAESVIPPLSTEEGTVKATQNKRTRNLKASNTTVVESEPPAPVTATRAKRPRETTVIESELAPAKKNKFTVGKAKRGREDSDDDTAAIDPEHVVPTKKVKTAPTSKTNIETQSQDGARRSSRSRTKTPKAKAKKTRRTKEEITADKARAEEEKKQQKLLTEKKDKAMIQMDTVEDVNRAETAARAIRTFADLDRDSAGEEFVGYDEISSEDSTDSAGESESGSDDAVKLKVRFLN